MKCKNCNLEFEKSNLKRKFCSKKCCYQYNKKNEGIKLKEKRRVKIYELETLDGERWESLLENEYYISNFGRIYSAPYRMVMKQGIDKHGYNTISVKKYNKTLQLVHRLVALTFIPNAENKPQVNHINGIKTNNRVENLEWCTIQENIKHSIDTGLKKTNLGYKYPYKQIRPYRYKPLYEIDKNSGEIIMEFKSITHASEFYNISSTHVIRCLNHKPNYSHWFIRK